ncbi:MAG: tandem-95 repeat protein [Candidatus Cloacimonetes bacterium]|nr:tandem-95 repeat protein [Candidatus Cloacimonadota bacterium]
MKSIYLVCHLIFLIAVYSSPHHIKPGLEPANKTASWVLLGKHWRAESNVPHHAVAKVGNMPQVVSPALGRYRLNSQGLIHNQPDSDGPYRIVINNPGFALINPGINREYNVSELLLQDILAVWLYEPSLRSYRVYRPNGVYLPSEHRLQTIAPGWPLFVETASYQASLSFKDFTTEFVVDGGANGLSSSPNLMFRPVSQTVLGYSWPLESAGQIHTGPLKEIRYLLEASPGIATGLRFSLYFETVSGRTKIAGADLHGVLVREFPVEVPETESVKLLAVIEDSYGREIVSQSLLIQPGFKTGFNLQTELARILNPDLGKSNNIRASVSSLNTGFSEAPGNFLQGDLQHIVVSISGSGISSQSTEFPGTTTSATLQIPVGNNRNIRVDYLDSTRSLIRSGQRTLNVTSAISNLTLEPAPTIFPELISFPASGYFAESFPVTLVASGAEILYTLDNSNPKSSSSVISAMGTTSVQITQSTTIQAFVRLPNSQTSGVRYFTFIKEAPPVPVFTASVPENYSNQFFAGSQIVLVSGSGAAGEKIRLADGNTFPLPYSLGLSQTTTFVFQTISPNGVRSSDYSFTFTQVELPELTYEIATASIQQFFAGTATIVLNSSVEGTELFYTLDDSTPDLQSASLLLPAQIELSDSATLRGFVRHPIGFIGSEFAYGFVKVPLPDPESLPDGYELEFGEVASIPFELGENIVVSVHTEPTQGILNLTQSLVEYTPNSGFFGEDFFVLEFLHEPTGLYFAKGFTMIVNEEPNQAPFISLLSPLSTDEDTNLDVSVSYSDPDGDELLFTADFMPAELGSVSVVGNLVSFVPGPNQSGTGNLLLTVCETSTSDQYCVTQSVSLTVAAVDDVPTLIVSDTSVVFDRNTTTSITFSVLELDGDSVNLGAVAYTGSVTNMLPSTGLGFVIENGVLTIIPAPNFYGSLIAGLQVCDATAENLCHFVEIAVSVNFVNQPPLTGFGEGEVWFSLDEDSFYWNIWNHSDPEGTEVTVSILEAPLQGNLGLTASGFEYTPVADFYGTDSFVFQFEDSEGGVRYQTFVATINPVNDAPQVFLNQAGVEIFSVVLDEDSSQNYTIVVTDADGDLIQVTASTEASVALTVSGGVLSVVPAPNWHGSGVIQVVACDNNQDSLCAEVDYLLTVNSVNDEPEFEGRDYVWNVVGAAGVSPAAGQNPSLAVDSQGLVYVSYQDLSVSNAISVKKFDGSSWVQVGSPNVSGGSQHFSSLAFDNNDVLYLAYSGAPSQIGVKRFNGSSWEDVALTSPGSGSYVKLLFDSSNQLYLAFSNSGLSNRASVMTLNGSDWEFVGSQAISPETAQHLNLVADPSGVLHISYRDLQGASRTGVRKFVGGEWVDVGNLGTMITYPLQSSLAFDSQGTPYVAFVDNQNSNRATVMKLNGSTWELVGPRAFTPASANYLDLLINSDDKLFLVFKDSSQAGKVSAMTWDSENWVYAGIPGVSAGDGYYHTAIIDAWDTIYTAFRDDGTSSKTTVFSMQSGPILTEVLENSSFVTTLVASDEDADILSYSIVSGLDGSVFTVDSISGELFFINPPDYENPLDANSDNVYELMVMVSDGNGGFSTQSINVQVMGVDEAPVISPVADLNLNEDYGSYVLNLPAVDPEGDPITLTLTSSNPGVVTVASASGISFTLTSPQDVFGESIMTLVANSTDKTSTLTFLVTVHSVNDLPMPIGVGSGSLTFVGTNPYLDTVTGEFPAVAFNSLGIPYVAFHDLGSGGVNVKKFVNGEWILVGEANFSSGGGSWIEIAIHSDDTVFVAYEDLDFSNQITVRKFNGTNWELVGPRGFSAVSADHVSLQIDSYGNPWVAFRGQASSYLALVLRFNGTNWDSPDVVSAGRADLPRLVLDGNNKAYVAYQDFVNGERIRVMAKEAAGWVSVPLTGLPTGAVQFPSMTVDSRNRLWLAFKDFQNGGGATVARFEGTHWEIIGTAGIGNIAADWIDLKLDAADVPYIIFNDADDSSRARMFSFQSGAWIEPTGGVISPFYSERTRLGIGPENQVVAVFRDYQVRIVANEFRELGWSAYAEENQSLALSLNAGDIENQPITYSLQGGPDVSLFEISGNQLLFLSPPDFENPSDSDADGTYRLNVSVSDGLSSVTVPVRIMVKNVDEAPVLYGLENLALSEDFGFFVVVPTFFDLEGDTMTVTVQSSNVSVVDVKLVQDKYILLNSVQDSYGPATIEISVSSSGLSTSVTFLVDVSPVADELMFLNERVSTWPVLGNAGFSAGAAEHHSLVIAPDGMPVVSYRDSSFGNPLAVVRKWDGSTWASVGTDGFSSQSAPYHTLAYDSSGILHLSYQDGGHSGKATLMRFENGDWNTVGSPGFTPGEATYVKLAIDTNDVPYVAYRDVPNGGKASVMKFTEGQWSNVFQAYISSGDASFISLDIDPLNRPVIAYRNAPDSGRTWVHRLEDGVWKHLNTGGNVLAINAAWQSIVVDRFATPYLAYIDQNAADLVLARYHEISGWVELARSPVAAGTNEKYVTLLIDNRDQIYVGLRNPDLNAGDTVVLKYVNNALQFVGPSTGISTADTRFTAMAVDADGKLYLAYKDINASNRTTVRHQELGPIVVSVLENQLGAVNIEGYLADVGLLEFAIVGGPDQNHFVIDSSGQVEFVTAPDYEYPLDANVLNMYEFSVQMNSGNVYTTVPVRVVVENVDEAPVLSPPTSPALNEDFGPHSVTLTAFDPDGDPITYIVSSLNPDIVSTPVVSGNVLIFTPVPDAYGNATISVTAIAGGLSHTQTFVQTISPINDAPSISNTQYTTWVFLGGTNMTETSVNNHLGFAVDQNDIPYLAFSDNAYGGGVTVRNYYEGNWDTIGAGGFSGGYASQIHLGCVS